MSIQTSDHDLFSTREVDPDWAAWLAEPPDVSVFTNDAGYLASGGMMDFDSGAITSNGSGTLSITALTITDGDISGAGGAGITFLNYNQLQDGDGNWQIESNGNIYSNGGIEVSDDITSAGGGISLNSLSSTVNSMAEELSYLSSNFGLGGVLSASNSANNNSINDVSDFYFTGSGGLYDVATIAGGGDASSIVFQGYSKLQDSGDTWSIQSSNGAIVFDNGNITSDGSGDLTVNGQFSFQGGAFSSSTDGTGDFITLKNANYYQIKMVNLSGEGWNMGPNFTSEEVLGAFQFYSSVYGNTVFQCNTDGSTEFLEDVTIGGSLTSDDGNILSDGVGNLTVKSLLVNIGANVPAFSSSTGTPGQMATDGSYIYIFVLQQTHG